LLQDATSVDGNHNGEIEELVAERQESASFTVGEEGHRVAIVDEETFALKCPSQLPHAKVSALLGDISRLHENMHQVDGEVMDVEETVRNSIAQWEAEQEIAGGKKIEYDFPSEVFDILHEHDGSHGGVKVATPTTYTVIFDETTQTVGKAEVVYFMSTNCHRLKVSLRANQPRPECYRLSEDLVAASKQLAFVEQGGVHVSTLAGSGNHYDHDDLNAMKDVRVALEFEHAHEQKQARHTPLKNSVAQLSHPWGCAYDSTDGSLFVTNTGVPNSSKEDDVLVELTTRGMAHVVAG
jgi:hypothetical protein